MRLKSIVTALALIALCLIPRLSLADSVILTLTGANSSPYSFTVNDTTTHTTIADVALSCLSDQLDVYTSESWNATSVNLGYLVANDSLNTVVPGVHSGGVLTVADLEGDAYLDSLYGNNASYNQSVQDAIWDLLDPSSVNLNSTGQTLLANALKVVNQQATESTAFYSQFTFYYPDESDCSAGGRWDRCDNEPQPFLGYTPAAAPATPEPSSLILMGTGLLGAAGVARRKLRRA